MKRKLYTAYSCGVTVYDRPHIGHARTYIAWDAIIRYLRYQGHLVYLVQNFTDVDQKIILKSKNKNVSPRYLTERYINAYHRDFDALNVTRANEYPRVTDHIPDIIDFIQDLVTQGYAYETDSGVYFSLEKASQYGSVSGRKNLIQDKTFDFALWKTRDDYGWNSPWGKGVPGWHIECSALIDKYLNNPISIHFGGSDLMFPHHENENAQTLAKTGNAIARQWFHSGLVRVAGDKMSKSSGNAVYISDLTRDFDPMAIRLWALQSHYKASPTFSLDAIAAAEKGYRKLRKVAQPGEARDLDAISRFEEYMSDDFNTPRAIALLFSLAKKKDGRSRNTLEHLMRVLGFKTMED